jgi:hypothetical protein
MLTASAISHKLSGKWSSCRAALAVIYIGH